MKRTTLFIIFCIAFAFTGMAQDVIRMQSCNDAIMMKQADSVKKELINEGFIVVREASMAMESEYEMAVLVPLNEGSLYQFIFIGDMTSRVYEVRMFDSEDKQVALHKKMWADVDGNVISFPYIPKSSEFHALHPVQVNKKKKNMCGYVILMKKVK